MTGRKIGPRSDHPRGDNNRMNGRRPPGLLAALAGRIPARALPSHESPHFGGMESLEARVLLAGDHPSLPNPFNPLVGDVIVLNATTGEGTANGTIGTVGDDDLFRFHVAAPDFVTVLANTAGLVSTLNNRLEIYDSSGVIVAQGNNNGVLTSTAPLVARDGWVGFLAQVGDYYARVLGEGGTTGMYQVRVDAKTNGLPGPFPTTGPNAGILVRNGTVATVQDDVVYRVDIPNLPIFDSLITVNATANPTVLDTRLEVYTAAGTLLTSDSDSGYRTNAFAAWKATPGLRYYVRVRSDSLSPTGLSSGPFNAVFMAVASELAHPVDPVSRRGYDEDHLFVSPSDTQTFRFVAQGTGLAIITTIDFSQEGNFAIRLYDTNGGLIALDDDFVGRNPQIEVNVTGGQRYFLVVESFEPPPTPSPIFPAPYGVYVEANHTTNVGIPVDDQVGRPANPNDRNAWDRATPIRFNPLPSLRVDRDGNPVYDHSYFTTGQGTGRIQDQTDSDLFSFVAPVDMLGGYTGNNDDAGLALFFGGNFNNEDPTSVHPVNSRNVGIWDAGSYWFTGPQAGPLGFFNNPGTPATPGAEIYSMLVLPENTYLGQVRPLLMVGGDFNLVVPTPAGPLTLNNLAVWSYNPLAGKYQWGSLGNANQPVRAMTLFDPVSFDPDGSGPAGMTPDPSDTQLIVGGDFTNIGGTPANGIARFTGNAWRALGTGVTGGSVRALAVYDPVKPGDERAASTGPPVLPFVADTPDPPRMLFIGGNFTNAGGIAQANLAAWTGGTVSNMWYTAGWSRPSFGTPMPPSTINGPVNALAVFDGEDLGGGLGDPAPVLVIGGQFTMAGGVAANNIVTFGRKAVPDAPFMDPNSDPMLPIYLPRDLYEALPRTGANGTNGPVFALTAWNPPDVFGMNLPHEQLVVGGQFTAPAMNIAAWDGQGPGGVWSDLGGTNGPVRSLTNLAGDIQEPGIPLLNGFGGASDPQEVLYAGGTFTMAGGRMARNIAQFAFNPNLLIPAFEWTAMRGGTDGTVFAMTPFDDQNPTFDNSGAFWDRNDRPADRMAVIINSDFGSFADLGMRIYDSNHTLIYPTAASGPYHIQPPGNPMPPPLNTTISPIFPDPPGMIDPAIAPGTPGPIVGLTLWGGQTYYIEVISAQGTFRNTGRYTVNVTVDAVPPDIDGNGSLDDPVAPYIDGPHAGNWNSAQRITVDTNVEGDGSNYVNAAAAPPLHGNDGRNYFTTPSRFGIANRGDFGNINTVTDTHLYYFRANADGNVEVRINTTAIPDEFAERIIDFNTNPPTATYSASTQTYDSKFDAAVRVFDNDQVQIAANDFNPGVQGETSDSITGRLGNRSYFHRDPRVVFPVRSGRVYYVQVESGQLPTFNIDPQLVDWRAATGAYELIINTMSDFNPDFSDDYANYIRPLSNPPVRQLEQATPIVMDFDPASPNNGRGSINGVIQNVPINNPVDDDVVYYFAPATGAVTATLSARNGSTVAGSLIVRDDAGNQVVAGLALPGQSTTVNFVALQGQRFFFVIGGSGGTQGEYTLSLVGPGYHDDHADMGNWRLATVLTINQFLGAATAVGAIETPGDTDLFMFTAQTFGISSVTVTSTSGQNLNPFVRVYEVQNDPMGNHVYLQIAFNDDAPGLGTAAGTQFSATPGRPYYIVVEGADRQADFGAYNLVLNTPPTDDHPNIADFPLASPLTLAPDANGAAAATGTGIIENPTDDDVFRFQAPASGVATVTFSRTAGMFHPLLRVLNSAGVDVTGSPAHDLLMTGNITLSFNVVRNQTYYIDIAIDGGPLATDTGSYSVGIVTPPADDYPNIGEFDIAANIILNSVTGVGTRNGIIRPSIDTDLFRFTTLAAGPVSINLTTPGSGLDPRIIIFRADANHTVIAGEIDDTDSASQIFSAAAPNETYYILVLPDPTGLPVAMTGAYTLTVTGTLPGGGGPPPPSTDDHPNAGNFAAADNIPLDPRTGEGTATGVINFVGDTDLFRFTTAAYGAGVTGDRPLHIQVTTPAGGLVDGSVRVFRLNTATNNYDQVAFDSNGIPGATAALNFDVPAGTTFYVLVEPVGSNTGSYTLRLATEPAVHYLYYPEGYAASTIDEFVPIVNPNNFPVTYSVIARYEVGDRDQVIINQQVIPANSRGGITINTHNNPGGALVRTDTPYAIEIQSNGQLGATFSHYDFGVTTGESFTARTSTTWTFSEAHRDPMNFRDFLIFYNPNNADASVTITLIYDNGFQTQFTRPLSALRRGGVNFTTDSALAQNGRFGIRVTSDQPIVAALSTYDIVNSRGDGLLGNADGGSVAGAVPSISTGAGVESSISILNTSATTASVTITASYALVNQPDLVQVLSIPANSRRTFTMAELGLAPGQPAGLRYTSNVPVTLTAIEFQNGDGDSTTTGTAGSTTTVFGDAFVNPAGAGTTYIESLGLYNPAAIAVDISIRFLFTDGTVSNPVLVTVAPHRFGFVRVDQQAAILARPGPTAFSIRLDGTSPFIASFTHYDLFLNGGWSALGAPIGLTNAISTFG